MYTPVKTSDAEENKTYSPVKINDIEENPKYRTIFGSHVKSATKFICWFNIIGLCLLLIGSFPVGLIFTIPLMFVYHAPITGIKELRPEKFIPVLILSGVNLVVAVILPFVVVIILSVEGGYTFELISHEQLYLYYFVIFFILLLQSLWISWCFIVILRCYEYVKDMKMADVNETVKTFIY